MEKKYVREIEVGVAVNRVLSNCITICLRPFHILASSAIPFGCSGSPFSDKRKK